MVDYYMNQASEGPSPAELKLFSFLPDKGDVLDIGCGAGRISLYLSSIGYQVTGVDVSEMLIQSAQVLARQQALNPSFVLAEGAKLPFADGEFDYVVAFKVLCYIPTRELRSEYLRQIYRLLRPGGMFLLAQPIVPDEHLGEARDGYYDLSPASRFEMIEEGDTFPLGTGYVHWFTKNGLMNELRASDFIVDRWECEEVPGGGVSILCKLAKFLTPSGKE